MFKLKLNLKSVVGFLLVILLAANIYVWTKSIVLGDTIKKMEGEIKKLRVENGELEREVYRLSSLNNLKSVAKKLGYTKESEPVYLQSLKYALVQ